MQSEYQRRRPLDLSEILAAHHTHGIAEPRAIDRAELLDQDAGALGSNLDLGPKRRCARACRGRRDDHRGENEQLVCLQDDPVPRPSLLVAA
jgi:hypothetical protein